MDLNTTNSKQGEHGILLTCLEQEHVIPLKMFEKIAPVKNRLFRFSNNIKSLLSDFKFIFHCDYSTICIDFTQCADKFYLNSNENLFSLRVKNQIRFHIKDLSVHIQTIASSKSNYCENHVS